MSAPSRAAISAWLAPEYPHVTLAQARAIRLGTPPRQIARATDPDSDLSAAEAHRWLSESPHLSPLAWLCKDLGLPSLRSWLVARWAQRVMASPAEREALYRIRELRGPAGQVISVRYADRIDEIQDCDLPAGPRTGVQRAFEGAAQRVTSARLEELARDHRVLCAPPPWRVYPCMRLLNTPAALVEEGKTMGHCVGGYAHAVESGRSVIYSIIVRTRGQEHRSTVELSREGRVLQHHGPSNHTPHALCQLVLARWQAWQGERRDEQNRSQSLGSDQKQRK